MQITIYGATFNVNLPTEIEQEIVSELSKNPEFIEARTIACIANRSEYLVINSNGVTNATGNHVSAYKGNEIIDFKDMGNNFTQVVSKMTDMPYIIDGHELRIQEFRAKTASNGSDLNDRILQHRGSLLKFVPIKPIEKDEISTSQSKDMFAWLAPSAQIGNISFNTEEIYNLLQNEVALGALIKEGKITLENAISLKLNPYSGWLCSSMHNDALHASQHLAGSTLAFVHGDSSKIVKAIEFVYYAKKAVMRG